MRQQKLQESKEELQILIEEKAHLDQVWFNFVGTCRLFCFLDVEAVRGPKKKPKVGDILLLTVKVLLGARIA